MTHITDKNIRDLKKAETIVVISLSYKTAGLDIRSGFQFSEAERSVIYSLIRQVKTVSSAVILSTCNRTEFYLEVSDPFSPDAFLKGVQEWKGSAIPRNLFFISNDTLESARYIMEIANGLHSMVLGDKQIISQMKQAFTESQHAGLVSFKMERLFQRVFRSYKRSAHETSFHKGSKSVSYLAVKKINGLASELSSTSPSVLLIGAGEISADFLKYASRSGFRNITIANRTYANAETLASEYQCKVLPYEQIQEKSGEFEVVISGAAGADIVKVCDVRKDSRTRLYIDLSVNRSINLPGRNSQYEVCTLDDLEKLCREHEAIQQESIPQVKGIIEEELIVFADWIQKRLQHTSASYKTFA